MAARKRTIIQRDFSVMETRDELLEADDLEVRARSLRGSKNMRAEETRVVSARPGTFFLKAIDGARQCVELFASKNKSYFLVIFDDAVRVYDQAVSLEFEQTNVDWTDATAVWVAENGPITVIGHADHGMYSLEFNGTAWAFGDFAFAQASNGSSAQPFWPHNPGVSIQPSARKGAITVVASRDAFLPGHVGITIRYLQGDILIDSYADPRNVTGTVLGTLPPSFEVTLKEAESTADISVGDTCLGQLSGWSGVVTEIVDGVKFKAVTTSQNTISSERRFLGQKAGGANYNGPDVDEKISFANTTQVCDAFVFIDPEPTVLWDEPLVSDVRGWPGAAAFVKGRLALTNFRDAVNAVSLSSLRNFRDFRVGAEDDDAILRTVGSLSNRFLHIIDAGDLLLFSSSACYTVSLRDGNALTPNTFSPVLFDARGANSVKPVLVDDGVIFIEANNSTLSAALLDGNVYLKWSVRQLSTLHNHLITRPVTLCGPSASSSQTEKYLFCVNMDGTMAAMSWTGRFGDSPVGFSPWSTLGFYRYVAPAFGEYWAIAERRIAGVQREYLERFDFDALVDCAVNAIPSDPLAAPHLQGQKVSVAWDDHYVGDGSVLADGSVTGMEDVTNLAQIGINFEAEARMWPVESMDSTRVGTIAVRAFTFMASVQSTGEFQMECNGHKRTVGGYSFGDQLAVPPLLHTKVYRAPITGRRDHNDCAILKPYPARLRILYLGQEVQV